MRRSPTAIFRTKYGEFRITSFSISPSTTHVTLAIGDLDSSVPLIRVQSACLTSTALSGIICDCADQMDFALRMIAEHKAGLFLYLDQEGRGLGLHEKVITMAEMNKGADTVTAFTNRGLLPDVRDYQDVGNILSGLGVGKSIRLLTNNPLKISSITDQGFNIVERVPLEIPPTEFTHKYLLTKKTKLGHILKMV